MQNAQALSQPIWMVTHAEWSTSRRTGRAEGQASASSSASSQISTTGPETRASWSSSTVRCTLCVPTTTSTWPALRWTLSRSFWARQPLTMISMPGRAALADFRWPSVP